MIKEMKPLTMVETKNLIEKNEGKAEVAEHLKKFIKLKTKDVEEMRVELNNLKNHKIREEYLVKIIDFLPETAAEINKIFIEVSLDENEIKQIIEIVKKFK
jgi:DNA-directed RNA polymerase subunit F